MPRTNLFVVICLFVGLGLLGACAQPKPLVYKCVNNFGLKQKGLTNTTVTMDLTLYNPNKYSMKLKSTDVDVYLNKHHLGKAQIMDKFTIPKLDTFSLPVMLRVDLAQVLPNALQLFFSKEVSLKLTGFIKAGKHGVFINIPVDYEGKQCLK